MLGVYRKTPGGKKIVYDNFGQKLGSYKFTVNGGIRIYDEFGNRTI